MTAFYCLTPSDGRRQAGSGETAPPDSRGKTPHPIIAPPVGSAMMG